MKPEEFATRLKELTTTYNDELTALVHEAQMDEFGESGWNTDKPLPYYDRNDIEECVDNIISHGAWVYDRIRGKNRLKRGSMMKAVRKLLGYTNP